MTKQTKAAQLRALIAKGAVMLPGVPNAAMARQVERVGFEAVYVSGAGMANATAGVPDVGLLTLTEVARLAGYIATAVKIPAIVDADTGFGGSENVARTIRELEAAGLAGCHIEDQEFPKRCGHFSGKMSAPLGKFLVFNVTTGQTCCFKLADCARDIFRTSKPGIRIHDCRNLHRSRDVPGQLGHFR